MATKKNTTVHYEVESRRANKPRWSRSKWLNKDYKTSDAAYADAQKSVKLSKSPGLCYRVVQVTKTPGFPKFGFEYTRDGSTFMRDYSVNDAVGLELATKQAVILTARYLRLYRLVEFPGEPVEKREVL